MATVFKLLTLSLCLAISACGFQLRGSIDLPDGVEPIFIGGTAPAGQLGIELRNLMGAFGIKLTDNAEDANYRLMIVDTRQDRRTATLGEGARVAEYQLIESITYELFNANNQSVLGPNRVTSRKILQNDPDKIASTGEEEKTAAPRNATRLSCENCPPTARPLIIKLNQVLTRNLCACARTN